MKDYLHRYLRNECDDQDLDSVIELMLSPEKKEELDKLMQKHWNEKSDDESVPDLTNGLYRIHYLINENETLEPKKVSLYQYFNRVAAILILPLMIAFGYQLFNNRSNKIERFQSITTPLASHTSFDLPDGSKVWLNAGSTITFPTSFNSEERVVKLTGQAYFDVKKDKIPFSVKTEKFDIKVLGTAFDVLAYSGEEAFVTLERGKVSLETSTGIEAILNPGEQAVIEKTSGQIQQRKVETGKYVAWKDNRLIFNGESFESVCLKLQRWFNVEISIGDESIKNIPVNGMIEYESISEVMQLLEISAPVKCTYNKNERKIVIKQR